MWFYIEKYITLNDIQNRSFYLMHNVKWWKKLNISQYVIEMRRCALGCLGWTRKVTVSSRRQKVAAVLRLSIYPPSAPWAPEAPKRGVEGGREWGRKKGEREIGVRKSCGGSREWISRQVFGAGPGAETESLWALGLSLYWPRRKPFLEKWTWNSACPYILTPDSTGCG